MRSNSAALRHISPEHLRLETHPLPDTRPMYMTYLVLANIYPILTLKLPYSPYMRQPSHGRRHQASGTAQA